MLVCIFFYWHLRTVLDILGNGLADSLVADCARLLYISVHNLLLALVGHGVAKFHLEVNLELVHSVEALQGHRPDARRFEDVESIICRQKLACSNRRALSQGKYQLLSVLSFQNEHRMPDP